MKTINLFNVVLSTNKGRISGVMHYFSKEDALKRLRACYDLDIDYLKSIKSYYEEDKDFEKADEGWTYTIHYGNGDYAYNGEIIKSVIAIPNDLA